MLLDALDTQTNEFAKVGGRVLPPPIFEALKGGIVDAEELGLKLLGVLESSFFHKIRGVGAFFELHHSHKQCAVRDDNVLRKHIFAQALGLHLACRKQIIGSVIGGFRRRWIDCLF